MSGAIEQVDSPNLLLVDIWFRVVRGSDALGFDSDPGTITPLDRGFSKEGEIETSPRKPYIRKE